MRLCEDTSGARAYERDCGWVAGRGRGLRGVMEDVGQERFEKELPRGQPFDDAHGRAAPRARPGRLRRCGHTWCGRRRWRDGEGLTTLSKLARTTARREEAEVANADEAPREDVQEEAPEEFVDVERERADLAPVSIVLPPKGDGVVGHGDEPVIRDGDAVGVARKVMQDMARAAKRWLRVDDPRVAIEGSEPHAKGRRSGERCERARKVQAVLYKSVT